MNNHQRLMSIEEILNEYLPIGRSKLYDEIRSGKLPVVKIGRRTLISSAAIEKYIDELAS